MMQPWSNQALLREGSIPAERDIVNIAEGMGDTRKRALFILAYLTAGRIQEIVRKKDIVIKRFCPKCRGLITKDSIGYKCDICRLRMKAHVTKTKKIPTSEVKPSIKKKDFHITEVGNRKVLNIFLRNQKHHTRKTKEIPIPLDRPNNINLYNMLIEYLNELELEDELFPINYDRAKELLIETKFTPHWIRHIRATHLVTLYDFNEFELMRYMGWTDSRPAKHYLELKTSDLLRKL